MSLPVAIQSVLYYILSCSTCNKVIHRRKAKVQAQKDRAEKAKIEDEQPGLYRHPSPFRTNPYWDEEIALGPNPARKKNGKDGKTESTKALNGAVTGNGSSITSSGALSIAGRSPTNTTTEGSRISGEGWNRKLYQRENEPLWGFDTPGPGQRIKDAIARAGSTAGRLFEGKLTSKDESEDDSDDEQKPTVRSYYLGRNPPVNDLHPPVVTTTPTSRAETSWMLQPPPSAKVMEGKERVGSLRSRADSNGSSRRGGDDTPLSRKVTEKLAAAKLRVGGPEFPELRPSSSRRSSRPATQGSVKKARRSSSTSSEEEDSIVSRRKQRALSVAIPSPSTPSKAMLKGSEMRELSSRPKLGTILSSSTQIPHSEDNTQALKVTSENTLNSRSPSPAARLSPNANSMPATLPSVSKFPGADEFVFPKREPENMPVKMAELS